MERPPTFVSLTTLPDYPFEHKLALIIAEFHNLL